MHTVYYTDDVGYTWRMKRMWAFLSDVFQRLHMHRLSRVCMMKWVECDEPEHVLLQMDNAPHGDPGKPVVVFEDKQAVKELSGRTYDEIATVNNRLDVN